MSGVGVEEEPAVGFSVVDREGDRWYRWSRDGWQLQHASRREPLWAWETLKAAYGPLMDPRSSSHR